MKNVTMLTVVPANLASELLEKKRIQDYNTLPQINKNVLSAVKEYMVERIGYPNLPMACLSGMQNGAASINGEDIFSYLPTNSKNSIIFQLEMPEDMIVSINFAELIRISEEVSEISEDDISYIMDELEEYMVLGCDSSMEDPISFIPFLAIDKCKFFAKFDPSFGTSNYNIERLEKVSLSRLSSFIN